MFKWIASLPVVCFKCTRICEAIIIIDTQVYCDYNWCLSRLYLLVMSFLLNMKLLIDWFPGILNVVMISLKLTLRE